MTNIKEGNLMKQNYNFTSPEIPDHLFPKKHDRKSEAIDLLEHLITIYKTDDSVKDIRLGQLLLNAVNNEHLLYHMESDHLKDAIGESLNADPNDY